MDLLLDPFGLAYCPRFAAKSYVRKSANMDSHGRSD